VDLSFDLTVAPGRLQRRQHSGLIADEVTGEVGQCCPLGRLKPGGQRHKSGTFTVGRITAKKRMVAKLKAIKVELRRRKHDRMAEVGAWLRKVVLGYYQYHAVPGNTTQLRIFKLRVCRLWQSVLVRRSQRAEMRWERLIPVLNRWIPPPRVLHPYPAALYGLHSQLYPRTRVLADQQEASAG
jgi:hypothetical protein